VDEHAEAVVGPPSQALGFLFFCFVPDFLLAKE
jgi:hypothetical protein